LLKDYAKTKLPLILSCGMSNMSEVYESLNVVGAFDNYPTILLLATSQYPTPPEDVHLRKLQSLSTAFPMVTIGFSDHTIGNIAASNAVGFGARVFEKHFTLDHDSPGPDHWFASEPLELQTYVDSIKQSFIMLGNELVSPTIQEKENLLTSRRSVTALENITKGSIFTIENIGLRRPGYGIKPKYLDEIIGKKSSKDIKKGTPIKFGDFV